MKLLLKIFAAYSVLPLISQSLMDLFAGIVVLAVLWRLRPIKIASQTQTHFSDNDKNKQNFYWKPLSIKTWNGLEKIFLVWLLVVALGLLTHFQSTQFVLNKLFEFKWVLVLYATAELFQFIQPSSKLLMPFLKTLCILIVIGLFVFFTGWRFENPWHFPGMFETEIRAGGIFGNYMTFSHLFAIYWTLIFGIFLRFYSKLNRKEFIWILCFLILGFLNLILTFTRGVWISLAVTIMVGVFLANWRKALGIVFIFGVMASISYFEIPYVKERIADTQKEYYGESERKSLWIANIEIFKTSPLYGVGYGQNKDLLPEYFKKLGISDKTIISHAHNQYIHLLAGTGILGLLCYLIFWAFFFINAMRLWFMRRSLDLWDSGLLLGSILAMIGFMIGSLTESNFEHSKVKAGLVLIWAFLIYLGRKYSTLGWKKRTHD